MAESALFRQVSAETATLGVTFSSPANVTNHASLRGFLPYELFAG